jgi:hypothetical protein
MLVVMTSLTIVELGYFSHPRQWVYTRGMEQGFLLLKKAPKSPHFRGGKKSRTRHYLEHRFLYVANLWPSFEKTFSVVSNLLPNLILSPMVDDCQSTYLTKLKRKPRGLWGPILLPLTTQEMSTQLHQLCAKFNNV